MKRVFLFLATNLAVMLTIGVVAHVLGLNNFITSQGLDFTSLLMFAGLFGFGGAFFSLAISKKVAKWTMKLQIVNGSENAQTAWLHSTVQRQAMAEGINMPEVAIYDSPEMNAFATGPSKNNSLVAVSTGLLSKMTKDEVEAVLGHEVAHVANGDMVTMTLLQGVLNTFVIFISRVIGYAVDQFTKGENEENSGPGIAYYATSIVLDILFGILASIIVSAYSRRREFEADKGGARLKSRDAMISALRKISMQTDSNMPAAVKSFGIFGLKKTGFLSIFASHPPMEERIQRLQSSN